MDIEKLCQLEQKINDVIHDADVRDYDVIFSALRDVFTFWMSTVCSECRRDVARKLKADIPAMLNRASQFAAETKDDPPACH